MLILMYRLMSFLMMSLAGLYISRFDVDDVFGVSFNVIDHVCIIIGVVSDIRVCVGVGDDVDVYVDVDVMLLLILILLLMFMLMLSLLLRMICV